MKVQIFKSYWTSKIVTNAGTFHCSPEECCFNFGEEYMTYNDVKNAKRYLVKVKRMQAGLKLSMSPQQRNIFRNCGVYLSYFQNSHAIHGYLQTCLSIWAEKTRWMTFMSTLNKSCYEYFTVVKCLILIYQTSNYLHKILFLQMKLWQYLKKKTLLQETGSLQTSTNYSYCSTNWETRQLICNSKRCKRQCKRETLQVKNAVQWSASLLKMLLFYRNFSHILLFQTS